MPIYEYACDSCEHRFDRLQSFKDDPVKVCPECGEASCRRLISAPGIVFKGSGWYIKDSKSSGNRRGGTTQSGNSESADKGSAEKSSEAKADGAKKTESTGAAKSSESGGSKKADA